MSLYQKQLLNMRRDELCHADHKYESKEFKNGYWHYTYPAKNTGNKKYTYTSLADAEKRKHIQNMSTMGILDRIKYNLGVAGEAINRRLSSYKNRYASKKSESARRFNEKRKELMATHNPEMYSLKGKYTAANSKAEYYKKEANKIQEEASALRQQEVEITKEYNKANANLQKVMNGIKAPGINTDTTQNVKAMYEYRKQVNALQKQLNKIQKNRVRTEERLAEVKSNMVNSKNDYKTYKDSYDGKLANAKYISRLYRTNR